MFISLYRLFLYLTAIYAVLVFQFSRGGEFADTEIHSITYAFSLPDNGSSEERFCAHICNSDLEKCSVSWEKLFPRTVLFLRTNQIMRVALLRCVTLSARSMNIYKIHRKQPFAGSPPADRYIRGMHRLLI